MSNNIKEKLSSVGLVNSPRGSIWRRWDIHIHAPGTLHNDRFKGDWDGCSKKIKNTLPAVSALGVTDYCTLDSYKEACHPKRALG